MLKIEGIAKKPGIALAVCGVVDVIRGVNGVSTRLLEKGMKSLQRQAAPSELPEMIIACDSLAVGMSTRLPGLITTGIAAESDIDIPGLQPSVPCVIGLKDLISSMGQEDMVIVDGNEGAVYIDPTPPVLIHYQRAMGLYSPSRTIAIDSASAPAVTKSGHMVYVFAVVERAEELNGSGEGYPDGYLITCPLDGGPAYAAALRAAAGKPVWFALRTAQDPFFDAVRQLAAPGQVVAVFDPEDFDRGLVAITLALANRGLCSEDGTGPPWVSIGMRLAGPPDEDIVEVSHVLFDLTEQSPGAEPPMRTIEAFSASLRDRFVVALGERLELADPVVRSGARCVAVSARCVTAAKSIIRNTN